MGSIDLLSELLMNRLFGCFCQAPITFVEENERDESHLVMAAMAGGVAPPGRHRTPRLSSTLL